MTISQVTKTHTYTQWMCDECGGEYSMENIAVGCSEKHVYRGEFEVGEYLTIGEIVDITYRRETIFRLLIERWNETREWIGAFRAKHYDNKITDPEEYRRA